MEHKPVKCPKCKKTLTHYIEGHATYEQKCDRCKSVIKIFSAGQTAVCVPDKIHCLNNNR